MCVGSKQFAVGKTGRTVSIYNTLPNVSGATSSTLTLSNGSKDNAYGMCCDNKGGLYADIFRLMLSSTSARVDLVLTALPQ